MKILLKNQNKYILTYLGLTLSIYSAKDIEELPSVKEIFAHFKAQMNAITAKIGANWQWFIHVLNFMAKADLSLIDNLGEDLPIFKGTCTSLFNLERKVALSCLTKYYLRQIEEAEELP